MYNNPSIDVFVDHNMKLCKMIEIYLKYDNMHTIGKINAFICINNHVNWCIKCMLSHPPTWIITSLLAIYYVISLESPFVLWSCN